MEDPTRRLGLYILIRRLTWSIGVAFDYHSRYLADHRSETNTKYIAFEH